LKNQTTSDVTLCARPERLAWREFRNPSRGW